MFLFNVTAKENSLLLVLFRIHLAFAYNYYVMRFKFIMC